MPELIQFRCPACAATLRLPLAMAAHRGPCPCCGAEIIAPDPYRGLGADQVPPDTSQPFAEVHGGSATGPPVSAGNPAPEPPARQPGPVVQAVPSATAPRVDRAVFVLSLVLTAVVSLVAGYLLGIRSDWLVARTPRLEFPPLETTSSVVPADRTEPARETLPVVVKPPPVASAWVAPPPAETTPAATAAPVAAEPPVNEPRKASAVAQAALEAFLKAPDWATRSSYALDPTRVRSAMEAYSRKHPDGPTEYQSIALENSYTDKTTGSTLFIFKVTTETLPSGFPVAVVETADGWNIDWEAFVEFRDDHFRTFADGPTDRSGFFHLIVSTPPPPRAANTENEHFSSFLLDPPLPGRQRLAYVRKSSEVHALLAAATANGAIATPVLELAKRGTPDGKTYLEVLSLRANDWLPPVPSGTAAAQPPPDVPH